MTNGHAITFWARNHPTIGLQIQHHSHPTIGLQMQQLNHHNQALHLQLEIEELLEKPVVNTQWIGHVFLASFLKKHVCQNYACFFWLCFTSCSLNWHFGIEVLFEFPISGGPINQHCLSWKPKKIQHYGAKNNQSWSMSYPPNILEPRCRFRFFFITRLLRSYVEGNQVNWYNSFKAALTNSTKKNFR